MVVAALLCDTVGIAVYLPPVCVKESPPPPPVPSLPPSLSRKKTVHQLTMIKRSPPMWIFFWQCDVWRTRTLALLPLCLLALLHLCCMEAYHTTSPNRGQYTAAPQLLFLLPLVGTMYSFVNTGQYY